MVTILAFSVDTSGVCPVLNIYPDVTGEGSTIAILTSVRACSCVDDGR